MTAGLITLPFAYANYQKKKAAYNAALEKYESLKGIAEEAADKYQESLENIQDRLVHADENGNYAQYDNAPGLKVYPVLQVGMMVGNKMNCRVVLTIRNESKDRTWNIIPKSAYVKFNLLGSPVETYVAGMVVDRVNKMSEWRPDKDGNLPSGVLTPGAEIKIATYGTPTEMKVLSKKQQKLLRSAICKLTGKSLVTSVPAKTKISGSKEYNGVRLLEADVEMTRTFQVEGSREETRTTQWMVIDHPAELQYMGEAFYPAQDLYTDMFADTISRNNVV